MLSLISGSFETLFRYLMKLHAAVCLYNDRTFLAAALESIKDVVDSVLVVDGAYEAYLQSYKEFVPGASAWSTDGSLRILEAFSGWYFFILV